MLRSIAFCLAALCCLAGSLTCFKAPSLLLWKLAIAVGELGHLLWVMPALLVLLTCVRANAASSGFVRVGTLLLSLLAVGLFLKPWVQATIIARTLPGNLERAYGTVRMDTVPLSWLTSLRGDPIDQPVIKETRVFSKKDQQPPLALDLYRTSHTGLLPCVIVIHGGGWENGDRQQFAPFNSFLARRGFVAATVDYRLAPQFPWPAQRDDIEAAILYLQEHASEFGIDPTRFVLLGRSAGGQIAEAVGYQHRVSGILGVISFYAPADLYFAWRYTSEADLLDSFKLIRQYMGGPPETAAVNFDNASPYLYVDQETVPTLLGHGGLDALVWHRQSERLNQRLIEKGRTCYFLDLPWATHAFDYIQYGPSGQLSAYAIEYFLRAVTAEKPAPAVSR